MVFFSIFKKKQKSKRRETKVIPKISKLSQPETNKSHNEILLKLDSLAVLLRQHDIKIENKIDTAQTELSDQLLRLGVAKQITRETSIETIVRQKLSQGETKSSIVKELVGIGACSRATAYRVFDRIDMSHGEKLAVSK